jgi:bifunctional UDP-N-acetylglucosamine pyrophosphorylase / glucosamine-1-phosphate N-acetyltransferase
MNNQTSGTASDPIPAHRAPDLASEHSQHLCVVILAAGQGKRMKSALPKVLHRIADKPMLGHVVDTAASLNPASICVVYGHGGETVRGAFTHLPHLHWARQEPQLGTGHAVMQALEAIKASRTTLVLYGDVPLIRASTLTRLVDSASQGAVAWLTQFVDDPTGLGRILRDDAGMPCGIVEHKDASLQQRTIREINTGFVACPSEWLVEWLPKLGNLNAQGEYYLTDVLAMAVDARRRIETMQPLDAYEVMGVNSRAQLAELERAAQRATADALMDAGVTLRDPARIDVRGRLIAEQDVEIDINTVFEGDVALAANVKVGANCILKDCQINEGTHVLPFTYIDGAVIGKNARIGPYARLRPSTMLADDVHIGNFVEVKASSIGAASKANHLSYVGDSSVGRQVNIGAGTITCNYDGANKHRTVIEDGVHIGSDVQLIAPVTIGAGADIAAGTTVWKDVPAGGLTLNEKRQVSKPEWQRPRKQK